VDEHDDQCEIVDRPPELAEQFDRIAGDNDARPGYPPWVFDVLVERCALRPGARVLGVGRRHRLVESAGPESALTEVRRTIDAGPPRG